MEPSTGESTISVVIPAHNAERWISRSIASVLSQTSPASEIIVIDDGSTDDTLSRIRQMVNSGVKVVQQKNAGVSTARNHGAEVATSLYIAFLDADDEWDSTFLSTVHDLIRRFPSASLFTTAYRLRFPKGPDVETSVTSLKSKSIIPGKDYFKYTSDNAFIHTSGVVVPRAKFLKIGGFNKRFAFGEDGELWARIAMSGVIAYYNQPKFTFYQTGAGGKPRFQKPLTIDPVLLFVSAEIESSQDDKQLTRSLKNFRVHYSHRIVYGLIRSGGWKNAELYMRANNTPRIGSA